MNTGLRMESLQAFINDNIYSLPGIKEHKSKLTVLLTGSRATETYTETSDVDIDVICSEKVFNDIQNEMKKKGLTNRIDQAFYYLPEEGWEKYFGEKVGQPHFSLRTYESVEKDLKSYEDIPMWIWNNALILNDPNDYFKDMVKLYGYYPDEVIQKKIKHRYLSSLYWFIDGYPHNNKRSESEIFSAALSIINGIHELYRFFFLLDGKPFPYSEKLEMFVNKTRLGNRFYDQIHEKVVSVFGNAKRDNDVWDIYDETIKALIYDDLSEESRILSEACDEAMISMGIDELWVEAGYDNIDELLDGRLGDTP